MSAAIMFPGQGSHRPEIGVPWRHHPAWSFVAEAEEILGEPIEPLLLADADVSSTRSSQLATFVFGLVVWDALQPTLPEEPVAFAGHSLGQITALVAAGVLDRHQGVKFVATRGTATEQAAAARPGRMAALLGASDELVAAACSAVPGECWPANHNAPGQVVIAGTPAGIAVATEQARELGIRKVIPLPVGGAFHTPLMDQAVDHLRPVVAALEFGQPTAPVVANEDARPVTDPEEWRHRLLDHLVVPVQWARSVEALRQLGATELVEPGADTLTGLAKRIDRDLPARSILTPDDLLVGAAP